MTGESMGLLPSRLMGWFQDPKLVHWMMTYWGLTRRPFVVGHFDFSSSLDLPRSSQEPVLERRSCQHQTPCLWNRRLIASLLNKGWEGGVVVWRCEPDLLPIKAHHVGTWYLTCPLHFVTTVCTTTGLHSNAAQTHKSQALNNTTKSLALIGEVFIFPIHY